MRVTRDDAFIKRRARFGTYATLAGFAVLIGGFIISLQAQYLWISLAALLVGFLLSQYGTYSLRRWGRNERPDEVIERALKGFDDRYHLYTWDLPAPYVLLTPQGLFSFVVRDQTGKISVQGSRWRQKLTVGRALLLFAQEGLGDPTREATEMANRVDRIVNSEVPDAEIKTNPAVVFVDKRAELEISEPTVPVLEVDGLKKWIRSVTKTASLPAATYNAIEKSLNARARSLQSR